MIRTFASYILKVLITCNCKPTGCLTITKKSEFNIFTNHLLKIVISITHQSPSFDHSPIRSHNIVLKHHFQTNLQLTIEKFKAGSNCYIFYNDEKKFYRGCCDDIIFFNHFIATT